jgi:hypothetical protein
MQRHTKSYLEKKIKDVFHGDQVVGGRSLHTARSIAQIFVGVIFMSRLSCIIFVADLIACRLNFYECCGMQTSSPKAVEWAPCVAAVNGACCS